MKGGSKEIRAGPGAARRYGRYRDEEKARSGKKAEGKRVFIVVVIS